MPFRVTNSYHKPGLITDSQFAAEINGVFQERKPTRIIETGTHLGLGTTEIICKAIYNARIPTETVKFYSIEANPRVHAQARQNLLGCPVEPLLGLSIPRCLLINRAEIEKELTELEYNKTLWVDGHAHSRVSDYFQETDFGGTDDLLGKLIGIPFDPQFVLLDSAGHIGTREFRYLISLLRKPCVIALNCTDHVKHANSVGVIVQDKRFQILVESHEKFGFCIAEFTPVSNELTQVLSSNPEVTTTLATGV